MIPPPTAQYAFMVPPVFKLVDHLIKLKTMNIFSLGVEVEPMTVEP